MSIGLLSFEQMMEADEFRAMSGLGALPYQATDTHKQSLTNLVRQAEATWADVQAGKRIVPSDFQSNLDVIRNLLTTKGWTDSSWTPEFMGGWPTSSDLLERVNRIHRMLIMRERPGAISPKAVDPSTGAVRQDSQAKAAAEEFARSLPSFHVPPPETVTNWGKVALGVAALLAVGYASGNLAKLLR